MEGEGNIDGCCPIAVSEITITDSPSSGMKCFANDKHITENNDNVVGKSTNAFLPPSHIDFLNLIFPPTPEQSPNSQTSDEQGDENYETPIFEEDAAQTVVQGQDCSEVLLMEISSSENVSVQNVNSPNNQNETFSAVEVINVTDIPQGQEVVEKGSSIRSTDENSLKSKRSLTFPPCVICSGKASGAHYGAITCEACKGFFRRYLQKKGEYKCSREGKCEIINRNRGNCSGCRLAKCLTLGMSKEKSKLGRYTLTKRTEAIRNMNRLKGKEPAGHFTEGNEIIPVDERSETSKYDPESEMIGRKIGQNAKNLNESNGFSELLVSELVQAMHDIRPYGKDITTKEQIVERHKFHAERYKQKIELFGSMSTVPKDEFNKLYKEFGIDVDGRIADMKICCKDMDGIVERYCNFAKHIPGFHDLPYKDQSSLLKVARADFFTIIMNECFSSEHKIYIGQDGIGYHFEEMADKFLSRELLEGFCDMYIRWQKLELSPEEKSLTGALTLVCTDRCKLENPMEVEKIQFGIANLLQSVLKAQNNVTSQKRFTKIIDSLTSMRNVSEVYLKEYNVLCKDDVIVEELPMLSEFFLEEYDTSEKK